MRLAYPNTDVDVRSTLERNAFEDSLGDPDMEWAVNQGKPLTIESAVKLALEFEAFRRSRRQHLHNKVNKAPVRVQSEEDTVQSEEDTGLKENKRETNNLNERAKISINFVHSVAERGILSQSAIPKGDSFSVSLRRTENGLLRLRKTVRSWGRGSVLNY